MTTLPDESICIAGMFYDNTSFALGEPNEKTLYNLGVDKSEDMFIARYFGNGTLIWATSAGGYNNDREKACSVAAFSDGSVFTSGLFYDGAIFGNGEPNEITLSAPTWGLAMYLARYNPDGTLAWAKAVAEEAKPHPASFYIQVTTSLNSVYMAGEFNETSTFGAGEPNQTILTPYGGAGVGDIFIARFYP